MKHDWGPARAKVLHEARCRVCASTSILEAAHIVPRSRMTANVMASDNIVPLCQPCHGAQHRGELELLPHLTLPEQAHIVNMVGIAEAFRRTTKR